MPCLLCRRPCWREERLLRELSQVRGVQENGSSQDAGSVEGPSRCQSLMKRLLRLGPSTSRFIIVRKPDTLQLV